MRKTIKTILGKLLGQSRLGALEYRIGFGVRSGFGGPLNGSPHRQHFFDELRARWPVSAIVETGTFRGTTTVYFASAGVPVYTVEADPRYFGFARARLRDFPNVDVRLSDSRSFLKSLASNPGVPKSNVFFYLDAHWYNDLPLRDELETIFRHWTNAVVMIDDFQVPNDPGYNYDDYGGGNALTPAYLLPISHLGFKQFRPVAPSTEEVGMKRGWTVLARDSDALEALSGSKDILAWQ